MLQSALRETITKGMKLPADVRFRKDLLLLIWKPRGILNPDIVNEIIDFIEAVEARNKHAINRFADLSILDAVDLNFRFVFDAALARRLSVKSKPDVKAAFYVTSPSTRHYAKLHALLTDYSPLDVTLFTDRAAAAKWLGVPLEALVG